MTLAAQMTTDLAAFFSTDEFAQAVTYAGSPIAGVVAYDDPMGEIGGAATRQKVLFVKVSDVASPAYRDSVIIDGATWHVGTEDEFEGDGYIWKLPLYRDERPII